jgi:nucleoside-diphosphate-sugar epimerase
MSAALENAGYYVLGIDIDGAVYWDALDLFNESPPSAEHFRMLPRGGFDVVVHCAAVVGGRAKIDGASLDLAVNLELDAALFRWAARARPGRVVYISSSAAYPVMLQTWDDARPLREPAITLHEPIIGMPDQLYGWSKLTGELLAMRAREAGVPVTVVRPFSGYGEDQSPDYPFAAFAARARNREDPFTIWGSGDQVRDWVHVDDICAAILACIDGGVDGPVNIGTGRGTPMRELARLMCAAAGYEPEFRVLPGQPSGVAYRVADVTRLREVYTPAVSLEEGVRRVFEERV